MTPIEPRPQPPSACLTAGRSRRNVRKGTRSCWECKRRKSRCTFDKDDSSCVECRRKGVICVSQNLPEETSRPNVPLQPVYDRLSRVEHILALIAEKTGAIASNELAQPPAAPNPHDAAIENQYNFNTLPLQYVPITEQSTPDPRSTQSGPAGNATPPWDSVQDALPTPADIDIIFELVSQDSIFFHQMMVTPYNELALSSFRRPESLANIPDAGIHPILLAKGLLVLATLLQGFRPRSEERIRMLSTSPEIMMNRLVQTAVSLMPTQDDSITTMEALECIMLEGVFYANGGNLRRSWLTLRRLISVAQLLDLHRPAHCTIHFLDPDNKADPQFVWFRILYTERILCLLLGKPVSASDIELVDEAPLPAGHHPQQMLERIHCRIVSRILKRNETLSDCQEHEVTQAIDLELQNSAGVLPQDWWLVPDLSNLSDSCDRFWAAIQLTAQLFHHHLILQTHLPFLLRPSTEHQYDYNKAMCINSSREILIRFIAFRSLDTVAFNCRTVDFFAVIATVAILAAQISSRCTCRQDDVLAYQRIGDRALAEQALDNMDETSRICSDVLYEHSANALRRMLDAENHAYNVHNATRASHEGVLGEKELGPKQYAVHVHLPHFGKVKIACDGVVEMEQEPTFTQHAADTSLSTGIMREKNDECLIGGASFYQRNDTPAMGIFPEQNFEIEAPYLLQATMIDIPGSDEQNHYNGEYPACALDDMLDGVNLKFL